MKIKELQKTVNIAWSPDQQYPIYLAAGTAAQQIDALNTNSVLEIYSSNLSDPSYDLEIKGCQQSPYRFQKIIWSPSGFGGKHPNGLIVGGCESGHLQIYNVAKLLAGDDALIAHQDKHTGPIRGLDFNPFQSNLLASVASESEVFIWDLNNTSTPMAPGTKTQPLEDIQSVAWNKQVQHILSTVFSSRCVIWDLRKNEQIIKLSDSQSRVRWRALQWHPDIATQLWLASEEDQAPFLQLWDLRYATAPAKTIQIHQRGILGLTWCPKDSDLMVSCGKDNKIFCWNPNSELPEGEILSEIATTIQWYSDVQWCPRNPALIASSSLDGNVSIYSLFGGSQQQVQTSNKIADSFPGMDQFAQAPVPQPASHIIYSDLKKTPKWIKRPVSVSFGFGGKLIVFNQINPKTVAINQVVTDPELIQRSNLLERTIESGNFIDYCRQKADEMSDQHRRYLWYFVKANFEANPRTEMLNLLGYNKDDMNSKFQKYTKSDQLENNIDRVTKQMATLTHSDSSEVEGDQSTDDSTDLSVDDNNALFDAIAAGNKLMSDTSEKQETPYRIPGGDDKDGLVCQAILSGNIEAAVNICLDSDKETEAIIIASVGGNDYLTKIQNRYLKKCDNELSNIISALIARDWINVMSQCTIDSWKEAILAAFTHNEDQLTNLCVRLGERLQKEGADISTAKNAILCYICAGSLEKLVDAWLELRNQEQGENLKLTTSELQDLIEIVMLLKKGLEVQGHDIEPAGKLAEILSDYASLLAAQGALDSALSYLGPSIDPNLIELRERLYYALGHKQQQSYSRGNITHLQQQQQQHQSNIYNKSDLLNNRLSQQRKSLPTHSQSIPPPVNTFNTGLPGTLPPNQAQHQSSPWNPLPQPIPPAPVSSLFNSFPSSAQPVQTKPPPLPVAPSTVNEGLSQPQRPSSVGSQGSTPHSRTKYVLDPSVTSGPSYGQTTNLYNPPQSQGPITQQPFNTPYQFNTSAVNSSISNSSYQSNPMMPTPPVTNSFQPFAPTMPTGASNTLTNPGGYFSGVSPVETAQQAMPPPPLPSQRNPTPPPGWNDPPSLKATRPQPKVEPSQVNPIVHPLFGANPVQGQNGYSDMNQFQNQLLQPVGQPLQQQQQHQQQQQQHIPFQPPPNNAPPQDNSNQFTNQMNPPVSQMYSPYQETGVIPPKVEPVKQQKSPLPEEFVYLQTVLEELQNQCINVAPDARTKRKVADVGKRLESLYDALRDRKLTQNTITALNQIVQSIQIGDYQNALATHTLIASGPDFSQTASFMPAIKVLVQSATELKIFLR